MKNRPNLRGLAIAAGLLLLQFWIPDPVAAQTAESGSKLIGRVLNAENGEPLAYANVSVFKTDPAAGDSVGAPFGGAMTAQDGTFRIACPPGSYRLVVGFVGFDQQKISGLEAPAGGAATVEVALRSNAMQLEEIEVRSTVDRSTESAILTKQKRAPAVSDGIGSQQIKKTPDSNAADVLRRVTGVSTVGGKYVYVRGLGERYSATQVNGSSVSTPEPNKKVVPLDVFSAGLLDNVVIQKTYTPDQPGEFAGGVVNLTTRDFPGEKLWEFSISSGTNTAAASNDFQHYAGGDTDFLGFDDGTRELPDLVERLAGNRKVVQKSFLDPNSAGFSSDTLAMLGQSFNDDWEVEEEKRPLSNLGLTAAFGNEVSFLGQPLGLLASAAYGRTSAFTDGEQNVYENDGNSPRANYETTTSEAATLWGAVLSSSYRLNPFHTVNLRGMYNRTSEDEVRFSKGFTNDTNRNVETTRFQYVERGMLASSLGMSHFLAPLFGSTFDWKVSYANAERNEPDRRQISYEEFERVVVVDEEPVDTLLSYQMSPRIRPTREFGTLSEDDRSYEASLAVPFRQWSRLEAKLKLGARLGNRDRSFEWRRFGYEVPSLRGTGVDPDSVLAEPADVLLGIDNIGGDHDAASKFWIKEKTSEADSYLASSDLDAAYVMVDLPLSARLRSVIGARFEHAEMRNNTFSLFTGIVNSRAKLDNEDVLPAVNLTYALDDASNLRAAFSKTVARPDLRELSTFTREDVVTLQAEVGNPDLERTVISNYDLRWERYPSPQELFAVSGFYKDFDNAIERTVLYGAQILYKPVNAESAWLYGAELEGRFALERLRSSLAPFFLTGNVTLVESEAELDRSVGVQFSNKRPLEGQSPYVVNVGLYYTSERGDLTGSILYNRFGRRLYQVGVLTTPDIYEDDRGTLDLTFTRSFRTFKLKLAGKNLTDEETRFAHDGAGVTQAMRNGRSLTVALSTGS